MALHAYMERDVRTISPCALIQAQS